MTRLRFLAALSIGLHALGLVAALFGMRPGTPVIPLEQRMGYIASAPGWPLGWSVWLLAAFSFVAFLAALGSHFDARGTLAKLALTVGVAAAAIDSCCDTIQIAILPEIAARGFESRFVFLAFERATSGVGIVVANGFYAVAVVLMTEALREQLPKYVRVLAWLDLVAALALSATGFFQNPHLPEIFTGPAIGGYILWVCAATRSATRR